MTAGMLRRDSPRTSWKARETGAVALGAVVLVAVGWAVVNGPRLHADAEQRAAVEMAAESEDVCKRLATSATADGGANCVRELDGVRQRHEDRLARRSASLL